MRSDPTFWILARASGLVAYALLTSSVLAGIVLKARPFGAELKQGDLDRDVGVLAVRVRRHLLKLHRASGFQHLAVVRRELVCDVLGEEVVDGPARHLFVGQVKNGLPASVDEGKALPVVHEVNHRRGIV